MRARTAWQTGRHRTAAIAAAGLVLYPPAIFLPILHVERFGHVTEASIVDGVASMLANGEWVVGFVILICSIVLPAGKLITLLLLSAGDTFFTGPHQRAWAYKLVELTGRWGMLDVLLLALLVAIMKLGDMLEVQAGPAAIAFTGVVVLSLLATAVFDPHSVFKESSNE